MLPHWFEMTGSKVGTAAPSDGQAITGTFGRLGGSWYPVRILIAPATPNTLIGPLTRCPSDGAPGAIVLARQLGTAAPSRPKSLRNSGQFMLRAMLADLDGIRRDATSSFSLEFFREKRVNLIIRKSHILKALERLLCLQICPEVGAWRAGVHRV
jgi:hypothetical protein